ncbi:hypothetical protein KOW79_021484 [Hemibagrus wyckioides]|uniref:Uncharacterized protein n=1 Tax=Hemibagrus wyckioides TaxID=337641 RepID=A0A9D3S8N3_9TELE|nr:hypothetical protein KOW79_021484 [Hemibagrus wyckioides]
MVCVVPQLSSEKIITLDENMLPLPLLLGVSETQHAPGEQRFLVWYSSVECLCSCSVLHRFLKIHNHFKD